MADKKNDANKVLPYPNQGMSAIFSDITRISNPVLDLLKPKLKKSSKPTIEQQLDKEISAFQDMMMQFEKQFGQMEAYNRNIDSRNQMRFLSEYLGRSASADLGIGSTKRRQGNPMQSASSVERALFGV